MKCKICGEYFDPNSDFMMTKYNEHLRTHTSWSESIR